MVSRRSALGIPQPYHLTNYTGTCPDVQYRLGKSFGLATHLAMCDPKVTHANKLALSRMFDADLDDDYGTGVLIAKANIRKQLEQEVMLLKGTRRPRNVRDRMMIDSPRLPLTPVTVECQGYKRPLSENGSC